MGKDKNSRGKEKHKMWKYFASSQKQSKQEKYKKNDKEKAHNGNFIKTKKVKKVIEKILVILHLS